MEDFVKSLKAFLYDRSSSPFFANLIFAWIVTNWEIVYLTLFINADSLGQTNKIAYLIDNGHINWADNTLIPLGIAVALTLIIPSIITYGIVYPYELFLKSRAHIRLKARKEKPYSYEKVSQLLEEIDSFKEKHAKNQLSLDDKSDRLRKTLKEVSEKNQRLEELQEDLNSFKEENVQIKSSLDNKTSEINQLNSIIEDKNSIIQSNRKTLTIFKKDRFHDEEKEFFDEDFKTDSISEDVNGKSVVDFFRERFQEYYHGASIDSNQNDIHMENRGLIRKPDYGFNLNWIITSKGMYYAKKLQEMGKLTIPKINHG